jgi:HPt (histidine-containing phosphotransfer) domain-containing protein
MIDWARVRELQHEIGKPEFAEVVGLFLSEADDVLARISDDLPPKALGDDCHYLKGAALNLGFQRLAALCQEAERSAKLGDSPVNLPEIRHCYIASRQALLAGLSSVAA